MQSRVALLELGEIDGGDLATKHPRELLHPLRVALDVHEDLVLGAAAQGLARLDVHYVHAQVLQRETQAGPIIMVARRGGGMGPRVENR
jgi:hypothetical protein